MTVMEAVVPGYVAALATAFVIKRTDWSVDAEFVVAASVGLGLTGIIIAIYLIRYDAAERRSRLRNERGD